MKQTFIVLGLVLGFWSTAQVHNPYVGVGLSLYNLKGEILDDVYYYPSFAVIVQGGFEVADNLEVRASFDGLVFLPLFDVTLAADLLYQIPLQERLELYLGAGPDLVRRISLSFEPAELAFGLHATAGLEYRFDNGIGLFAEVRPKILTSFQAQSPLIDVRSGVNFYF